MPTCKNGLHQLRGPADLRNGRGGCLRCSQACQRRYMKECRAARRKLRDLEALIGG